MLAFTKLDVLYSEGRSPSLLLCKRIGTNALILASVNQFIEQPLSITNFSGFLEQV